jgi:hypothetical protein
LFSRRWRCVRLGALHPPRRHPSWTHVRDAEDAAPPESVCFCRFVHSKRSNEQGQPCHRRWAIDRNSTSSALKRGRRMVLSAPHASIPLDSTRQAEAMQHQPMTNPCFCLQLTSPRQENRTSTDRSEGEQATAAGTPTLRQPKCKKTGSWLMRKTHRPIVVCNVRRIA